MQNQFEYTLNMESIFQGKISELKSYYCREDMELALSDYDRAPKDSKKFKLRDVSDLCKARDIDPQKLIADRTILDTIPTRSEIQEELLQSFYDMYSKSPATSDFMERIVRRLAPEYNSDTVRVAILKKFITGAGNSFKKFHTDQFWNYAKEQLSKSEASVFKNFSEEEKKRILLSKIDDSIFEHESVELTSVDILKLIIDRMAKYRDDDILPYGEIELSEDTKSSLLTVIAAYEDPSGKTTEEELRILYECMLDDKIAVEDFSKLVDGIESDFRNLLKTIRRVSKTGKAGTVDELYKQAKKDAVKAKKKKIKKNDIDLGLIEMCNDLAAGNFRVNGKTKVYLYYFAFMFGMTLPLEGRECEPERNIVTNLFQDYYNDNFLRLLSADYENPKNASAFEKEPTGEGINYKSFVEMIYLYFLCRDDLNLTPGEKIDQAEAIIDTCVKRAKENRRLVSLNIGEHTDVYRNLHVNVLLNKEPDEIADYILAHYQVFSPDNAGITRIMVASEENTASDFIEEIMEDLDGAYSDIDMFSIWQRNELTKEVKADITFKLDTIFDWRVKTLLEERYSGDKQFLKVVNAIDKRTHINHGRFSKNDRTRMLMVLHILMNYSSERDVLSMFKLQSRMEEKKILSVGNQISNAISRLIDLGFDIRKSGDGFYLGMHEYDSEILNKLLSKVSGRYYSVDDESELLMAEALVSRLRFDKRVTRCELIALHFNLYIALLNETEGLDTFPSVFEDYAATINPYLEESRYQPLSEKNIFDMYIVTALYFYLVENNGYM